MKKYEYKVQGVDYEVEIEEVEGNIAKVKVNDIPFEVELKEPINAAKHPAIAKVEAPKPVAPAAPKPAAAAPAQTTAAPATGGNVIKSPLPGTITTVNVNVGDSVTAGQVIVVLEAMKMQNDIESDYTGTVTAINISKGDTVMEGAPLLTIG